MILSKQIIEFGLDENYIRYLHSKTKLSQFTIEGVEYVRGTSDTILIRLKLILDNEPILPEKKDVVSELIQKKVNSTRMWQRRQMSLEVSKSKMREKKLNQLLN
jgi:hypothetical protein